MLEKFWCDSNISFDFGSVILYRQVDFEGALGLSD